MKEIQLCDLPVSFCYGEEHFKGFAPERFSLLRRREFEERGMACVLYSLAFDDGIVVRVKTEHCPAFAVHGWTVWFENSGTAETKCISQLRCIDMELPGSSPAVKGILGDHTNLYRPYAHDLSKQDLHFAAVTGRATHVNFPYFLLESNEGAHVIALGWAGTWDAQFSAAAAGTRITACGTSGLCTYLKPGEVIRTPLAVAMECPQAGRGSQDALNRWRRWILTHNLPRSAADSSEPVQPMITNCLSLDTGRPNSDGSISEYHGSWRPSLEKYYAQGLEMDIRWVDAGWYCDPENRSVPTDWWGTVGTWEVDREKWPNGSFRESSDYALERGARTMLWFEPERVTHPQALVKNYGFDASWVLSGGSGVLLCNLGNPHCVQWLTRRITDTMEALGVHMYREDFNCDPAELWHAADKAQGEGRHGITENLYVQGHYRLWDNIIAYCAAKGKLPFVDSCASGGGRNDLESLRRSVPVLRSDSDRTTAGLRLAMTASCMHWLPCCGASTKEAAEQLAAGKPDLYVLRASYLPVLNYSFEYVQDKSLDFALLRQAQQEWKRIKPYFYGDFYTLTPWHPQEDLQQWTAFYFHQPDGAYQNSGVLLAFRQEHCTQPSLTVQLPGVQADAVYTVEDIDCTGNGRKHITGSRLQAGFTITLEQPRSAAVLFIAKAEPEGASLNRTMH